MHELARQIVERVAAAGRSAADPLLQSLFEATQSGKGTLLRLSTRRLVLKHQLDGAPWLFKIDSPQRNLERLRGRLRQPSLLREANNLRQLGLLYPPFMVEVHTEQRTAASGLLARRWIEGRCGNDWLPEDAAAIGHGLATLHQLGWSDPDLSPADLLLDSDHRLLPLDLGHAFLHEKRVAPAKARWRDLERLLGGWPEPQRLSLGKDILDVYRHELNCPPTLELLHRARVWRLEIMRRQSRRCLRRTRDFAPNQDGGARVEDLPPGEVLRLEFGQQQTAKRLFRLLYELELLQLPALRVLRFGKAESGAYLEVALPPGGAADLTDRGAIESTELALRKHGFCLSESHVDMFYRLADGSAVLANPRCLVRC